MDLSYGITCRKKKQKKPTLASHPSYVVHPFSGSDLQILRSSLIIICLLGDAARFRCGNSCSKFIFCISHGDRSIKGAAWKSLPKSGPPRENLKECFQAWTLSAEPSAPESGV